LNFDALIQGFATVFMPYNFLLSLFAVAAGIMVGALPGLTAIMACALLVPVTFGLETVPAFVLLLGIYCGAIYGGSISAILINIPGTPSAAATMVDGFAMARNGEAGKALGMACIASAAAGLISAFFMTFMSPQIARIALQFGPPEYFGIALFALSVLVMISGKSLVKGLISAVFGLMLTTIGMDPNTGFDRFTFGSSNLLGGITLLPAIIGMFAFTQIFEDVDKPIEKNYKAATIGKILPGWQELKHVWVVIVKSSLIGSLLGAIPGIGGETGCFVALGEAKRSSKYPEKFGTGILEGIAAPEAGNNGTTGGAMIPMLSLGIPGDAVTAVMLGGLMLHGLTPGPLLFKNHLDIVYPIFASFILANIIMGIMGITLARFYARVINIKKTYLIPSILVLSIIGSYAIQFSFFDVGLALVFGVMGYFMRYYGYPLSPVMIALILGPIAEQNFCRSLMISHGSAAIFFQSPIFDVFLLLAIASLAFALYQRKKMIKASAENTLSATARHSESTSSG
jgi:putative tricarboxylic transport membrane protein